MLWIWSYPVSKKELLLKLGVPEKQAKSLKTKLLLHFQAEILFKIYPFTSISREFSSAYKLFVCGVVKNLIIQAFVNFYHHQYITIVLSIFKF